MKNRWIAPLFLLAGVYDGLLGVAFLFWTARVFEYFAIVPPNHFGYVQFGACLLLVFAIMFFSIAARPAANRNLIPYGILLKASYCGVIAWHWILSDLPFIWKPFAVCDFIFGVLFIAAYAALGRQPAAAGP